MFLQKIDHYILKNIVRFAVFYTIVPTLILWIVQSRKIFELALGSHISSWVILKLSSYLIPPILPHILPFATILAAVTVLVRLYNDSELGVLWAAGLSPARLMRSFIIFGLGTMLVVLGINFFLAPQMSRQLKVELFNVKNDIIRSALKPGVIQTPQDNLTIYIDNINGKSYIEGFYLQQKSDDNQMRIFTAKQALLSESNGNFQLLLLQGRILNWHYDHLNTHITPEMTRETHASKNQNTDNNNNNNNNNNNINDVYPTVLEFDKFTLNISDIMTSINNSQDLQFKAQDYSISELLTAQYAKTPQEKRRFIIRGHEQIITSFFPIVFIMFAVIIMLRPIPPRGFPYQFIVQTIALAVLFRIFVSGIQNLADNNLNLIYLLYALPLGCVAFMIIFVATTRRVKQ